MATSISYSSTASGGKTLSKSVTAINPKLSNAVAKTFTQKLNALTTNTLSSINRIDKTEIDPNKTYPEFKVVYDTPVQGVTYSDDGFTVTVDSTNYGETSAIIQVQVGTSSSAPKCYLPADYGAVTVKYFNGSIAIFDMSADNGTHWQIGFFKYDGEVQKGTATAIFPEGTVTDGTNTYEIPAFTITVNVI